MKKTFILVAMAFLLIGAVAVAEEAVLIDFQLLNADIIANDAGVMTQNRRTVMDYGTVAGASYTDEQKALMNIFSGYCSMGSKAQFFRSESYFNCFI